MKEERLELENALFSMRNGILNLRKLQRISLDDVINFLQNPSTPTDKIIAIDISNHKDWEAIKDFILKLNNNSFFKPQTIKISEFRPYMKNPEFVDEILSLRLITKININNDIYIRNAYHRKESLLKKFLEEFKKMILIRKRSI